MSFEQQLIAITCMFAGTTAMFLLLASLVKRGNIKPDISPLTFKELKTEHVIKHTGEEHEPYCTLCNTLWPEYKTCEEETDALVEWMISLDKDELNEALDHRDTCEDNDCTWCNPEDQEETS